jgi:hypothetical protein
VRRSVDQDLNLVLSWIVGASPVLSHRRRLAHQAGLTGSDIEFGTLDHLGAGCTVPESVPAHLAAGCEMLNSDVARLAIS